MDCGIHGILPSEVCHQDLPSVSDVEDLYGAVRGAGGQSGTIVVHLCIVLKQTQDVNIIISGSTFQKSDQLNNTSLQQRVLTVSVINQLMHQSVLWCPAWKSRFVC